LGQAGYSSSYGEEYRLRPADVISVNVFREPDLSIERVPIGADGVLSMPLLGPLTVQGLTTSELGTQLASRLAASGLKSPQVSVNVLDYLSHQVTVEGAVVEPGVFNFQPGSRLSSALSQAKGLDRIAKLDEVVIFRESDNGIAVARFDYGAVRQGTMIDPVLQPGDRVVVGISSLSQFWQDFLRAAPVFAIFTNLSR
jgi:polysaccharide export outer membrane protein